MTDTTATIRVLIVDDDEDDFFLAQDLLEEIGQDRYQLDWASTFEEGLHQLNNNEHHLCLMDYKLGAHDGIELLALAQQQGFNGPVILLTGMRQGELDIQALEAGAVDYLVKAELSAQQLERSIRYALARRDVEVERIERLRAEAENRSKSEFLAHLSHELRTPLSAVLGFTELLLNKAKTREELSHLQVIQRNGKYLLGLLNDILDLSKIEAGKLELELQWINLSAFLSDIYLLMQGTALDKDLQLVIQAKSELPVHVKTDPTRLRQVLINLIGNGIKFTQQGRVTINVEFIENGQESFLSVTIIDTGVGIAEEDMSAIFDPFVQSNGANLNATPGTGLGLAISRQLATLLGGDITLTSKVNVGSQFALKIAPQFQHPLKTAPFQLQQESDTYRHSNIPQFKGRVLVVDDLEDLRILIGHFVRLTGVTVDFAENGMQALDKIDQCHYDAVLMDINMPVKDGIETAKELLHQGYTQPLIALTAANMKGDKEQCLEQGFSDYLSKPVDQQSLYECLSSLLSSPVMSDAENNDALTSEVETKKTILLVEDDNDAREAMTSLLNLSGYHVLPAPSADEAIKLLDNKPQLVITDLNLPGIDGYELSAHIHQRFPELNILALSGDEPDRTRAMNAGISQHLLKPISLQKLQDVLGEMIPS